MIVVPQLAYSGALVASGEELPPVAAVRELGRLGAREVQLLDLDGGSTEDPVPQWLEALVAIAGIPVRYDGRLHDGRGAERLTRPRFSTLVIDHHALFDPMLVRWTLDLFGPRLCVEVQVDGEYLFDPPKHAFGSELVDVLSALHVQGIRRVLYRDVTGAAPPLAHLQEIGDRVPGIQYSYAGAARSLDDVRSLAALGPVIEAVIVDAAAVASGSIDILDANRIALGAA